jgi:hypothetical protein
VYTVIALTHPRHLLGSFAKLLLRTDKAPLRRFLASNAASTEHFSELSEDAADQRRVWALVCTQTGRKSGEFWPFKNVVIDNHHCYVPDLAS